MSQKTISELIEQRREYYTKAVEAKNEGKLELCDDFLKRAQAADTELRLAELEARNEPDYDENEPLRKITKRGNRATPELGSAIVKAVQSDFANVRGITSTTGSGAVQDPLVRGDYFAAQLAAQDFFAKTGIQVEQVTNYSQWPVFSDPAVQWQAAEGDQITESSMAITGKQIVFKTCAILVKISKQLVRDASPLVVNMINDALLKAFAEELGRVVLRGSGTNEPLGLDGVVGVQSYDVSGSTLTTWSPHLNALKLVHAENAELERCSWVTGSNGMLQIESFDDSQGQYLQKPPVLQTMPYAYTSHVKEDYSGSKTRLYVGDFSNCLVGVAGPYILPLTQRYGDYLQDAFLLWAGVDLLVRRPGELCKIINVGLV